MFSSSNQLVVISAVILSLLFIASSLYFVNKLFKDSTQEILVKFILLVFTALVGVYVIDKVIAFKISLLTVEEDKSLFDLIKTLILIIFSYYFGTKKDNNNSK
jgi:uncharacterized protein YacL